MIKNNIEVDVKVKCIEHGLTQVQLAETIGTTSQYINCTKSHLLYHQKARRVVNNVSVCFATIIATPTIY